ncbi:MAG: hypothetical protein Hals2KO_08900 [Halioglobus sp.]
MKTLNQFKRTAIAGVATATLGMTLATPAQADLFAYAKLLLEDFTILGSDGELLDAGPGGDFSFLSFTSSGDMNGDLTGTGGFSFSVPSTGGDIDFPSSCLSVTGDCNPLAENALPFLTGAQGADYVAADQIQVGSPILGLGLASPANVGALAVGSLSTTSGAGSANANNGLEASWQFSLTQDTGITFEGDISVYLEAFASAGELSPGKASAATEFGITITNLTTGEVVFNSADELGGDVPSQTTAADAGGFPVDITTCGGLAALTGGSCGTELNTSFSFTTVALEAGTLYQLSARNNVNIDIAREAPVPGVLALMGAGLLGIFAFGRRRAQV